MNIFITFTSLLSICLLTSCSTFKGSSAAPNKLDKEVSEKLLIPVQKPLNSLRPASDISLSNVVKSTSPRGRTIKGMIEPDVTQLPDNKDLQESINVVPTLSPLTPKLKVPVAPMIVNPSDTLPSNP